LSDLDQLISKKLEEIDKAAVLTLAILQGKDPEDFSSLAQSRAAERTTLLKEIEEKIPPVVSKSKRKKGIRKKKDERSTYDITLDLLNAGMTIAKIAHERGLTEGTIESHLAKAVGAGRISIFRFMTEDRVEQIMLAMEEMPEAFSSKELYEKLNGKFSYGELRAAMTHAGKRSIRKMEE